MPDRPLPCISCGAQLESVEPTYDRMQHVPYAGTLFRAHGHFGSTAFDPMGDAYLEIVVCDACLVAQAARVEYVEPDRTPRPKPARRPWNPSQDG